MIDDRRDQLIDFVEKEFIGPDPIDWEGMTQENGEEILRTDPPRTRYLAGILFPQCTTDIQVDTREDESIPLEETTVEDTEQIPLDKKNIDNYEFLEDAEELINRSNAFRQSAISITVSIKNDDSIRCKVTAGTYRTESSINPINQKKSYSYPRTAIKWNNNDAPIDIPTKDNPITQIKIDNYNLKLDVTYRYMIDNNTIVTFSLENTKVSSGSSVKDDDCFFQSKFIIYSQKGFSPLPVEQKVTKDEDYLSNQLLYRNIKNYAIGHGISAEWDDNAIVKWISTATFPKYEIKPIIPNSLEGISLDMYKMSKDNNHSETIKELKLLCEKYQEWINDLIKTKGTLDPKYEETANRHISNCEKCLERMKKGVALLEQNKAVQTAFQYMNLAMLQQQLHYNLPLQTWNKDKMLNNPIQMPVVDNRDTWYGDKNRYGKWRPFQLAFILINLRSMLDHNSNERGIVDLIWFPTGGGKTEAYLGLSAYTIFIRRLLNREDSGTAILMRYTLRLLTAQQYERASALICACELIRKNNEQLFGNNKITIGLWVGGTTTPNNEKIAVKKFIDLYNGGTDNPFVILKCPWCGAQMGPVEKSFVPGYKKIKRSAPSFEFVFQCDNKRCDFNNEPLPLYVVDQTIYKNPPTLLLGTVDKFAMLPYLPEAQSIFGIQNGKKISSPDLIIQDELHLISGPLGSMVGHYETLINELCTLRNNSTEIHPKIIASTATISHSKDQCHALYGCSKEDVFQFPPSGLDAGDSFFAVQDKSRNGRRYVGIMATGSSSDATTAIRLFAALLYGTKAMIVDKESDRDPYWTNMGYYNSIRELGQAKTWIHADVDQQLDVMYKRRFDDKRYSDKDEYRKHRRYIYRDEELTSRIPGNEITSSLANLGIRYCKISNSIEKENEHPIDICLATNMISVGLDVPRLGLMTVAGQPKTTSEYIQATSRVGRDEKNAPGVIFVLFRPGRPRDKSHYESFISYHSKIYSNVEPTSITPFSSPVRDRALHAIMIGMMRMESNAQFNQSPPKTPDTVLYKHVEQIIEKRVEIIDANELEATKTAMNAVKQDWEDWSPQKWVPQYNADGSYSDQVPLMYSAGTHPNILWNGQGLETPTSMRSVDASCEAEVLKNRYTGRDEENDIS